MKSLVKYLTEGKTKTFKTTLKKFLEWYDGYEKLSKVDADWLANCSLDYLEDDLDMSLDEIADLFNKHFNDEITIEGIDLGNVISHEFNLDNTTVVIETVDWFGNK